VGFDFEVTALFAYLGTALGNDIFSLLY
jgi:hypothetical protein